MPATLRRAAGKADEAGDEAALTTTTASSSSPSQRQVAPRNLREVIPDQAQFPLAVATSFAMASLGYSLLGELTGGQLAAISRSQDTWGEVTLLAGWRVIELALGWYGKLDGLDVAMLDLLSHGPHYFLLSTFYNLSATTALWALAIDIASVAVPFSLLRPLSTVHTPSAAAAAGLPNRELIDLPLQLYTTALSTGIYTVVLVLSLRFILPRILVVYYTGVPTLEPAYTASYPSVLPVTLLFGVAASTFIFAPFATTARAKEDDKIDEFDPVAASLGETVWWNVWGYTAKTKVVVRRTAIAALVAATNTFLASTKTLYGVESAGAAVYASVWAFAALCTGIGLGFVGGD
ncbi:uncharacterized protein NECHADRAFT_79376 [Fusarium vanettenii 77-13-4]|uniref:Uncharacterized protein n=1 Tax=Fusarium vanettenii (strain ATCC MYA-4622 / CBS 123669 / FGSC 9596 / NRRL 45880 / 77-13-4) TaxID=660122 RepID=C7YNP4_FUSV7|nr:uncharacterized protein NECHADRAFT_79376 [Fusarium vanettenii 77-13-4]EEU46612.1 hypothetical protein NECHADRAFT_79376 [Fusarium vanettenii 77-13-4]